MRRRTMLRQLALAAETAGRRVLQVERAEELPPTGWFRAGERVGLTAGTSTLGETVAAVRARLEAIADGLNSSPNQG